MRSVKPQRSQPDGKVDVKIVRSALEVSMMFVFPSVDIFGWRATRLSRQFGKH
jgi:hypothetical protein